MVSGPMRAEAVIKPLTLDHREVSCANLMRTPDLLVILALGQSNSANFGLGPREAGPGVYSFYEGRCFRAIDPLPGADGRGASIWTRMGQLAVNEKVARAVLIVPAGAGATTVEDWAPGGRVHQRMVEAIRGTISMGFTFTHIIWMQGEHDAIAETASSDYFGSFQKIYDALRGGGVDTPIFVSQTSLCGAYESSEVTTAQHRLSEELQGVYPGPNTDELGTKYRYDTCHFNEKGLDRAARLWLKAIKTVMPDNAN